MKNKNTKKSETYKKIGIGAAIVVVLAIIILLLLRSCGAPTDDPGGIEFDPSATEGGWDEADLDAIRDSLNEKVEEGMINISMNTSPVFSDGESAGSLMIVNEDINRYPISVEITRNDNGDVIYTSKAVPVGSKIEADTLDIDLPAGTYECTAMFFNLDPDTGDKLGSAGVVIELTVLE